MAMKHHERRGRVLPYLALAFLLGGVTGWWMHKGPPLPPSVRPHDELTTERHDTPASSIAPVATSGRPADAALTTPATGAGAASELRGRDLRVPIDGANIAAWKGNFEQRRGERGHEAVDILAPRNTPIHAVEDGTIARLFESKAGGHTIYQFDPTRRFAYYYAHLERYADGLAEGKTIARGDVIGYVGTSGNAPKNTPHLHFTIFELTDAHHWWEGRPIDPYLVFSR
jgi:murein DD-endopeptidase MepM/ murein hydrolase activator NlpD